MEYSTETWRCRESWSSVFKSCTSYTQHARFPNSLHPIPHLHGHPHLHIQSQIFFTYFPCQKLPFGFLWPLLKPTSSSLAVQSVHRKMEQGVVCTGPESRLGTHGTRSRSEDIVSAWAHAHNPVCSLLCGEECSQGTTREKASKAWYPRPVLKHCPCGH